MEEEMWPEQPNLKSTPDAQLEEKPICEIVSFVAERQYDEFDDLLLRKTYWSTVVSSQRSAASYPHSSCFCYLM